MGICIFSVTWMLSILGWLRLGVKFDFETQYFVSMFTLQANRYYHCFINATTVYMNMPEMLVCYATHISCKEL